MSTHTHDNQCDAGERCLMCIETTPCCPDCDLDTRDSGPAIPTFDTDWSQAPRLVRRLITEADAEWFWLKGEQAGRIAEQVETRRWLRQLVEGYSERVGR